jgi:hypothetical protein
VNSSDGKGIPKFVEWQIDGIPGEPAAVHAHPVVLVIGTGRMELESNE